MTAQEKTAHRGRVQFGRLPVRPDPISAALAALGDAVPVLEGALGFPVSVTAQAREDGTLYAEVFMPEDRYTFAQAMTICTALQDAARPFGVDVNVEVDSDAPHGE